MRYANLIVLCGLLAVSAHAASVQTPTARQVKPEVATQLVTGKTVVAMDGAVLGTITTFDGEYVKVKTARGEVKLPAWGFGTADYNTVRAGVTVKQVNRVLARNPFPPRWPTPSSAAYPKRGFNYGPPELPAVRQ